MIQGERVDGGTRSLGVSVAQIALAWSLTNSNLDEITRRHKDIYPTVLGWRCLCGCDEPRATLSCAAWWSRCTEVDVSRSSVKWHTPAHTWSPVKQRHVEGQPKDMPWPIFSPSCAEKLSLSFVMPLRIRFFQWQSVINLARAVTRWVRDAHT